LRESKALPASIRAVMVQQVPVFYNPRERLMPGIFAELSTIKNVKVVYKQVNIILLPTFSNDSIFA
jgi:hypothetical protein